MHHYEKHFYENEVVKTGQYRDHRIEEIDDRCFVMFITRYPKGRPRGFPRDKSVYVCESRYNEEKFKFNKIKTWASCLPDEVREKDYEMDLYPVPIRMKKVPSPIKHLLQVDAKETDDPPKPTWANANAPPMIGAVHRRPREPNVSLPSRFPLFNICLYPWLPYVDARLPVWYSCHSPCDSSPWSISMDDGDFSLRGVVSGYRYAERHFVPEPCWPREQVQRSQSTSTLLAKDSPNCRLSAIAAAAVTG